MKKVWKKCVCLAIASVMCISTLGCVTACKEEDESAENKSGAFIGFETFEDAAKCNYYNYFGRVEINKQSAFVSEGKASLKINAIGDSWETMLNPTLEVLLNEGDYADITKLKEVTFDMYNDTEKETNISYYFTFETQEAKTQKQTIQLQPKAWTKISYAFDSASASLLFDLTKATSLCFEFNKPENIQAPSDLYLDNIKLQYTEEGPKLPEIQLGEKEICSFDKLYQLYVVLSGGHGDVAGITPKLSINDNPNFAKSGKSLKVEIPKGRMRDTNNWPYFEISSKVIEKANLGQYPNTSYIVFDVYNDSDEAQPLYFETWRKSVSQKLTIGLSSASPKTWTTYRIPFAQLNEKDTPETYLTKDLARIRIAWYEFAGSDRVCYFDDFRIETE